MTSPEGLHTTLYDAAAVSVVLDRMAAEVAHRLRGAERVTFVGVRRRGAPLADHILQRLRSPLSTVGFQRLDLSIKRYADDLSLLHPETQLTEDRDQAGIDLGSGIVIVVDDVLYQGFSLSRAVGHLLARGAVQVLSVVLVDRLCARVPVHADVVGLRLEVAPSHIVECHVPPYEPTWQIVLVQPAA